MWMAARCDMRRWSWLRVLVTLAVFAVLAQDAKLLYQGDKVLFDRSSELVGREFAKDRVRCFSHVGTYQFRFG